MYIGPKSRTERPRKTKIGTEVGHITRDSDTTFKVKRSRSQGRAYCGGLPHILFMLVMRRRPVFTVVRHNRNFCDDDETGGCSVCTAARVTRYCRKSGHNVVSSAVKTIAVVWLLLACSACLLCLRIRFRCACVYFVMSKRRKIVFRLSQARSIKLSPDHFICNTGCPFSIGCPSK